MWTLKPCSLPTRSLSDLSRSQIPFFRFIMNSVSLTVTRRCLYLWQRASSMSPRLLSSHCLHCGCPPWKGSPQRLLRSLRDRYNKALDSNGLYSCIGHSQERFLQKSERTSYDLLTELYSWRNHLRGIRGPNMCAPLYLLRMVLEIRVLGIVTEHSHHTTSS